MPKSPKARSGRVPFTKQASEVISVSDIILETLDARFIEESRIAEKEEKKKKTGNKQTARENYDFGKKILRTKSSLRWSYRISEHGKKFFVEFARATRS